MCGREWCPPPHPLPPRCPRCPMASLHAAHAVLHNVVCICSPAPAPPVPWQLRPPRSPSHPVSLSNPSRPVPGLRRVLRVPYDSYAVSPVPSSVYICRRISPPPDVVKDVVARRLVERCVVCVAVRSSSHFTFPGLAQPSPALLR